MNSLIGLCLAFKTATNYGAILQAYATQQIVEAYGFRTEIIDFTPGSDKGIHKSPEYYLCIALMYFTDFVTLKLKTVIARIKT